ncbi:MAG: hypothetical protein NZ960_08615 [Candidatus Kapabacteria bacterium]|nr:hypothetical protein [Candidatus Kapabacteria bacterium]MDW8076001.1 hypothetical protein [Bacteroidota bacterium]
MDDVKRIVREFLENRSPEGTFRCLLECYAENARRALMSGEVEQMEEVLQSLVTMQEVYEELRQIDRNTTEEFCQWLESWR